MDEARKPPKKLVELGYSNIVELGGILDWNGEIEKICLFFNK